MENCTNSLYRWKRKTNPRIYSRSQHLTCKDDVENWLQKVEEASSEASHSVLREEMYGQNGGMSSAKRAISDAREYDETHSEAQELLQQWMSDKLLRSSDDLHDVDDSWQQTTRENDVRREWDRMLEDNGVAAYGGRRLRMDGYRDVYNDIYNMDEDEAVDLVLDNLLNQDYVADNGREFLVEKTTVDPRVKMQLRQEQVKKNRELREDGIRKKREEQQRKKDAVVAARIMLQKDGADKVRERKREEGLIQQEMSKIRKEMEDEKRKQKLAQSRKIVGERREESCCAEKCRNIVAYAPNQSEIRSERDASGDAVGSSCRGMTSDVGDADTDANQASKSHRLNGNLEYFRRKMKSRILRRHFSRWYESLVEGRLLLGQVAATRDWKLMNKAWASWKNYCRRRTAEREMKENESVAKNMERKMLLATTSHRLVVLCKFFATWRVWMKRRRAEREDDESKARTRAKMLAFLQAAETRVDPRAKTEANQERGDRSAHQISTNSTDNSKLNPKCRPHRAKEAWQATRRDDLVTKEEIRAVKSAREARDVVSVTSDNRVDGDASAKTSRNSARDGTEASGGFHHRFNSQQTILHDQRRQIKDQQRLIEDLQFEQNKQVLEQQAACYESLRQQLCKNDAASTALEPRRVTTQMKEPTPATHSKNNVMSERDEASDAVSAASNASQSNIELNVFVKNMNDRAAERARLKGEREENRRKMDEERLTQLRAEEAEVEQKAMEMKRERRRLYAEKKLLERQKEEEKLKNQERMKAQMDVADDYYKTSAMKYRGFLPWRKLMLMKRRQLDAAVDHHQRNLLRDALTAWRTNAGEMSRRKTALAQESHDRSAVRRCFSAWTKYKHYTSTLDEAARGHHRSVLMRRVLAAWVDYATDEKMKFWRNERSAKLHNEERLVNRCFCAWKRFPQLKRAEAEGEKRRLEMKRKVAELLPDYTIQGETRRSSAYS